MLPVRPSRSVQFFRTFEYASRVACAIIATRASSGGEAFGLWGLRRSIVDVPWNFLGALMIKAVGGCILQSSITRYSKRRTVDGLRRHRVTAVTTINSLAGHLVIYVRERSKGGRVRDGAGVRYHGIDRTRSAQPLRCVTKMGSRRSLCELRQTSGAMSPA